MDIIQANSNNNRIRSHLQETSTTNKISRTRLNKQKNRTLKNLSVLLLLFALRIQPVLFEKLMQILIYYLAIRQDLFSQQQQK